MERRELRRPTLVPDDDLDELILLRVLLSVDDRSPVFADAAEVDPADRPLDIAAEDVVLLTRERPEQVPLDLGRIKSALESPKIVDSATALGTASRRSEVRTWVGWTIFHASAVPAARQ